MLKVPTKIIDGKRVHVVSGTIMECSGQDCYLCKTDKEAAFNLWERSIPYPIPPKGKRYRDKRKQAARGKTIKEICFSCQEIPCYICRRTACPEWGKIPSLRGQEKACYSWDNGKCRSFVCKKGLIQNFFSEYENR